MKRELKVTTDIIFFVLPKLAAAQIPMKRELKVLLLRHYLQH